MRPVSVVTGAGRGIGAATALRLATAGHDVAISYLRDDEAAQHTAEQVRRAGGRCVAIRADVAVESDVEHLFDGATAALGPITGLVNNAGVTSPAGPLLELSTSDLRRVVDVNLIGTVLCCRRATQHMATSRGGAGGVIVNVSSGAATLGGPGEYVHYAAAKAGVDTLTIGLAQELAPENIRVNAVQPGLIRTDLHARETRDGQRLQRLAPSVPLGRAGEPDEIAAAIAWLLSSETSYVTGAVLRVAGGR